MVFNWEKSVRNGYEDLLADTQQLSKEPPLVLETAYTLQCCVRCEDIEGAVCKRQSLPPSDLHANGFEVTWLAASKLCTDADAQIARPDVSFGGGWLR